MKFELVGKFEDSDIPRITNEIISVDPEAEVEIDVRGNTVDVDSWLFAEEFLVAFFDVGYDVRIIQR